MARLLQARWPSRPDRERAVRYGFRARSAPADCVTELESIIGSRTLAEWHEAFETLEGVWAPVQSPVEVREDPQVVANGYLPKAVGDGVAFELVASPVQFGREPLGELRPAPALGAEGDDVLRELGLSDDELIDLKIAGALQ